jgi:hypothetical protein
MIELVLMGAAGVASAAGLVGATRLAAGRAAARAARALERGVRAGAGAGALVEPAREGWIVRGATWRVSARATVRHLTPLLEFEARWEGPDLLDTGDVVVRAARALDDGEERVAFALGRGAPSGKLTRPGKVMAWMWGEADAQALSPESLEVTLGGDARVRLEMVATSSPDEVAAAVAWLRALTTRLSVATADPAAWWSAMAARAPDDELEGLALAAAGAQAGWSAASPRGWALGRLWHGDFHDVRLADPLARGPERALAALSAACEVSHERGLGRARAAFSDLIARHCVRLDGAHAALGLEWEAWSEWMLGHALRASQARTPTTASTFLSASARARATVVADARLSLGVLCAPMTDEVARELGADPLVAQLIERGSGVVDGPSHPLAPYAERGVCVLMEHLNPVASRVAGRALERFGAASALGPLHTARSRAASAADAAALARAAHRVSARARSRSRRGAMSGGVTLSTARETLGALTPLERRGELTLRQNDASAPEGALGGDPSGG